MSDKGEPMFEAIDILQSGDSHFMVGHLPPIGEVNADSPPWRTPDGTDVQGLLTFGRDAVVFDEVLIEEGRHREWGRWKVPSGDLVSLVFFLARNSEDATEFKARLRSVNEGLSGGNCG